MEVSCDPESEQCFERNCSNPDDCPLNELSIFKRYSLRASDFELCENGDCGAMCENGEIQCEEIECIEDLEMGEGCSTTFNDQEGLGADSSLDSSGLEPEAETETGANEQTL